MKKEPSILEKDSEDQKIISSIQMGIRRKRAICKSRHRHWYWHPYRHRHSNLTMSFTEYKLVPYIFLPNSALSINVQPKDC